MLDDDTLSKIGIAAQAATDKKAFDLVGLEVGELTSYADSFLLCSAASDRQVGAVVDEIERRLREAGSRPLHIEGEAHSDWVLLDFGDLVVHVFTEDRRAFYALDHLWGDAPRIEPASLGLEASPIAGDR
ncbi:MAG: ribosome silencing factor [Thermoanaerobaculales bacterium]|jgi:ribosome-associated protein|nr:ribosome silencing factor [Thermoanaerobaculales bacterium]